MIAWLVELLMVIPVPIQMDWHPCVFLSPAIVLLMQHLIRWRYKMAMMPWTHSSQAQSGQDRTTTLGSVQYLEHDTIPIIPFNRSLVVIGEADLQDAR